MAAYLCVKANNTTKSFTAKDTKEAGKPYLCVKANNSIGYFPLTTETSTGTKIKIKANNTTYEIVETYTTTAYTSVETTTTSESTTYDRTQIAAGAYVANLVIAINSITAKYITSSNSSVYIYTSQTTEISRLTVTGYIETSSHSKGTWASSVLGVSNIPELNEFYSYNNSYLSFSSYYYNGKNYNNKVMMTTETTINLRTYGQEYTTLTKVEYYSRYNNQGRRATYYTRKYKGDQAVAYDTYFMETGRFISVIGTVKLTNTYNTTTSSASTTTVISQ